MNLFDDPPPLFAGEQRYQRVASAVRLMQLSKSTVYGLIRQGKITARKVGRSTFIDMASVAALFERCPRIAPQVPDMSAETFRSLGFPVPPDDPALELSISESELVTDNRIARQIG